MPKWGWVVGSAAVVVLFGAGATVWELTRDSGPTSDERAACGAMRDVGDSLIAETTFEPIDAAIVRMTSDANRTSDSKLIQAAAQARVDASAYDEGLQQNDVGNDTLWRRLIRQLATTQASCESLGIPIALPSSVPTEPPTTFERTPNSFTLPLPTTTLPAPSVLGRDYAVTSDLNIRSGSGTNFSQVGSIPSGATARVSCTSTGEVTDGPFGPTDKWDRVTYNGATGYVTDEYVDTKNDITNRALIPLC